MATKDIIGLFELDRVLLGREPTAEELRRDIQLLDVFDRDVERQIAARAQLTEE